MMYDKNTPAQVLFDDEVAATKSLIAKYKGEASPVLMCEGLQWLQDQLAAKPAMTLDEFAAILPQAQGDRGQWAAAVMRDVGDKLYPELRAVFMAELHGDNCTEVAKHCRNKLSSVEKDQLRRQFKAREEPSTDLETELK